MIKRKRAELAICILLIALAFSGGLGETARAHEGFADVWVAGNTKDSSWYDANHVQTITEGLRIVSEGGTVHVHPGIYYENIVWPNKQGTKLVSTEGAESTILDGNRTGRVLTFVGLDTPMPDLVKIEEPMVPWLGWNRIIIATTERVKVAASTVIDGFTIQNGLLEADEFVPESCFGGGILCFDSSPTIQNCIFIDNEAFCGGAICCFNSSSIIRENVITNNEARVAGGGIESILCKGLIEYNTIADNLAGYSSGGIECWNSNSGIQYNTISSNSAKGEYPYGNGGGILCGGGASPSIYGNIITDNSAALGGGGICVHHDSSPHIINCTIRNNLASWGSAIKCGENSNPMIYSCDITDNFGEDIPAVYCLFSSSPTIIYCTISANQGDGIYCRDLSQPLVRCNNIIGNEGYGVRNDDRTVIIEAEYNWWGESSGPAGVGPGTGDEVGEGVSYDNWLKCEILGPVEEERLLTGIHSTFDLHDTVVELDIRVMKEDYSNKIYNIEILTATQEPMWDSIEALTPPEGWSSEEIGCGLKFYTETNPLLKCRHVKFKFRVKAERISWYIRIYVTDQTQESIGMIICARRWLYSYYPM